MRSFQGTGVASSAGSYDARDNSSYRSSAHNLAVNNDPNYNLNQSDSALEEYEHAVVVMEFHGNLIYIAMAASALGILSALLGLVGIFRENRLLLSWYSILLWPVFALYISVGYIAFRRAKNHLRTHLREEWVHSYSREQRLLVQRNLKCCGYQDPAWFGEYDLRCFPMINLPGCQHKYNVYEDKLLTTCWTASFTLAPFQLFVMIAALLCSNHVDGMLRSGRPGLKTFKQK
ncbi:hypothetical protein BGX27_011147 [Mortierella sp. AM989]|nr:hypothetical protein BGX27_011147 [Mortierella sp. AM989]